MSLYVYVFSACFKTRNGKRGINSRVERKFCLLLRTEMERGRCEVQAKDRKIITVVETQTASKRGEGERRKWVGWGGRRVKKERGKRSAGCEYKIVCTIELTCSRSIQFGGEVVGVRSGEGGLHAEVAATCVPHSSFFGEKLWSLPSAVTNIGFTLNIHAGKKQSRKVSPSFKKELRISETHYHSRDFAFLFFFSCSVFLPVRALAKREKPTRGFFLRCVKVQVDNYSSCVIHHRFFPPPAFHSLCHECLCSLVRGDLLIVLGSN